MTAPPHHFIATVIVVGRPGIVQVELTGADDSATAAIKIKAAAQLDADVALTLYYAPHDDAWIGGVVDVSALARDVRETTERYVTGGAVVDRADDLVARLVARGRALVSLVAMPHPRVHSVIQMPVADGSLNGRAVADANDWFGSATQLGQARRCLPRVTRPWWMWLACMLWLYAIYLTFLLATTTLSPRHVCQLAWVTFKAVLLAAIATKTARDDSFDGYPVFMATTAHRIGLRLTRTKVLLDRTRTKINQLFSNIVTMPPVVKTSSPLPVIFAIGVVFGLPGTFRIELTPCDRIDAVVAKASEAAGLPRRAVVALYYARPSDGSIVTARDVEALQHAQRITVDRFVKREATVCACDDVFASVSVRRKAQLHFVIVLPSVSVCETMHIEREHRADYGTFGPSHRVAVGDDHLRVQLRIGNDPKTLVRPVNEPLERLRHRLQILASHAAAAAADNADNATVSRGHANRVRKQRNKIDPLHAQCASVRVRFFAADNDEIVDDTMSVSDALRRTKRIAIGESTHYVVLLNQPTVVSLSVRDPLLAGIPVVPLAQTEFCEPHECTWRWFRLDDRGGTLVRTTRRYVPTGDDIGVCFRIECRAPSKEKSAYESAVEVVTSPVVRGPDRTAFAHRQALGKSRAHDIASDAFRVMTYNVLFDGYTTSLQGAPHEMFPYTKPGVMDETYRMQLVFQEIEESNADIVCLQEMGRTTFQTFFEPMLQPLGYATFYTGKMGTTQEGCAVLIRTDRFEVVAEHTLAVSAEALDCEDANIVALLDAYPELRKGLEKIPSIAQLLVLRDVHVPTRRVLLANTHLYYREDADMIRVVQAAATVRAIERLKAELTAHDDVDATTAVVFCGDFNAVPDSAAVRFLLNGVVDDTHRHWQELRDFQWARNDNDTNTDAPPVPRPPQPSDLSTSQTITHDLALQSACGLPAFTNFAGSFVATLDYILCGHCDLEVAQMFPLFTRQQVSAEVALPASAFPSDHISLISDLRWRA